MKRNIVISLLTLVMLITGGVVYAQQPAAKPVSEDRKEQTDPRKDELSKKLLQRKQELSSERPQSRETEPSRDRKDQQRDEKRTDQKK